MATIKQKTAIKKVLEFNGNVSKAMKAAGYPATTASNPQQLTRSKAWKELVEEKLDDDLLLQKHKEALEATKWNDFTGEREADHTTRLKGVELGYKIKRRLGPDIAQQFNLGGDMTLEFVEDEGKTE